VLFLDELPEFSRSVLEVLREPLESGRITISRAARQADFPAAFHLVTAMNPCRCGYLGHHSGRCGCTPPEVALYRRRISGPLLDRIDLHIEMPSLQDEELFSEAPGESSARVRLRVVAARRRQLRRQRAPNARIRDGDLERHAPMDAAARRAFRDSVSKMGLSARAHHRMIKVARTIADLAGSTELRKEHVTEALSYRSR
jgi:magnesium chelatase family protein